MDIIGFIVFMFIGLKVLQKLYKKGILFPPRAKAPKKIPDYRKVQIAVLERMNYFSDYPDDLYEGEAYRKHIENAFDITNGVLYLESFKSTDLDDSFVFYLRVNSRNESFSVRNSSCVDSELLVKGLNQILENSNYIGKKKFVNITGNFFDFAIGFLTEEEKNELIVNRIMIDFDSF